MTTQQHGRVKIIQLIKTYPTLCPTAGVYSIIGRQIDKYGYFLSGKSIEIEIHDNILSGLLSKNFPVTEVREMDWTRNVPRDLGDPCPIRSDGLYGKLNRQRPRRHAASCPNQTFKGNDDNLWTSRLTRNGTWIWSPQGRNLDAIEKRKIIEAKAEKAVKDVLTVGNPCPIRMDGNYGKLTRNKPPRNASSCPNQTRLGNDNHFWKSQESRNGSWIWTKKENLGQTREFSQNALLPPPLINHRINK
ncbi:MAG: hypothetical protein N2B06_08860 [Clostridium sp.]